MIKIKSFIKLILAIVFLISCEAKVNQADQIETAKSIEIHVDTLSQIQVLPEIIAPKGSQVFHESVNLRYLKFLHRYRLTAIQVAECEDSLDGTTDPEDDKKVNNITFTKDTFTVHFSITENCCSEFLCEAEIVDESTLNIIYHSFGRDCSCNCKFDLQYTFTFDDSLEEIGQKRTTIQYIQFNNEPSSKVAFK